VVALAAALAAIAAFFVAAGVPDRVRLYLDAFHRPGRIVALDHELASPGAPVGGVILDHHRKAEPGRNVGTFTTLGRRSGSDIRHRYFLHRLSCSGRSPL
jgi:hypothetical protein